MKKVIYKIPILLFFVSSVFLTSCKKELEQSSIKQKFFNQTAAASVCDTGLKRYRDKVFSANEIYRSVDFVYRSPNQYHLLDTRKDTLKLDFYEPLNDTATKRPLIVWMHGGGSAAGSKNDSFEIKNCIDFARRGYAVICFDYRITPELWPPSGYPSYSDAVKAYYRGMQDARFAIRFAKQNANLAKIDTNKIFMAGLSNGACQTLHVAYLDDDELQISPLKILDTLGSVDFANAFTPNNTGKITAGIAISSWIWNIDWIEAGDPPMLFIHSSMDNYAPITEGTDWVYGLFYLWGPQAIVQRLNQLGIATDLKVIDDGPPFPLPIHTDGYRTHGNVVTYPEFILAPATLDFMFTNLYNAYFHCNNL
ncbi:alpha/beta hydrolase [Ferruginibacter sp.]